MSYNLKIQDTHLQRCAYVYIRQSSATQVLVNRESTERQYQWSERAVRLGWSKTQTKVIDKDLAHTGSGLIMRNGFVQMANEVALGQVGIILCLEAPRVSRHTDFTATSTSSVPSSSMEASASDCYACASVLIGRGPDRTRSERKPNLTNPGEPIGTDSPGSAERRTSSDSTNISPAHASTPEQSGQPPGPTHSKVGARTSPQCSDLHPTQKP
jgi:hypothetical protein